MKFLTRLIKGPRPLRPKYLRAMAQLCPDPIQAYWDLLNDRPVLIRPPENDKSYSVRPNELTMILELHAHGLSLIKSDIENTRHKWHVCGQAFYTRCHNIPDLNSLYEVFVAKLYEKSQKYKIVLDIGGYLGESAIYFAQRGAEKVVVAEPSPANISLMKENITLSKWRDKIDILPVAISSETGYSFLITDDYSFPAHHLIEHHEFMKMYIDEIYEKKEIKVEVWSFEKIINFIGHEEIDLVKMDCEGSEYAIMLENKEDLLQKVRYYIIEYHNGADKIIQKLTNMGYNIQNLQRGDKMGLLYAEKS